MYGSYNVFSRKDGPFGGCDNIEAGVSEGHWKGRGSIDYLQLPISTDPL